MAYLFRWSDGKLHAEPEPQPSQQQTGLWDFITKAGTLVGLIVGVRSLVR